MSRKIPTIFKKRPVTARFYRAVVRDILITEEQRGAAKRGINVYKSRLTRRIDG